MDERIVVLDDDINIVDVVTTQLKTNGYECVGMESPAQALQLFEGSRFALLLTDLKMPELDGMEVVRQAKEKDPDLAVVVLTGLGDVTRAIEAMRLGADDYILKPFNLNEITVAVGRALENRRLVLENRAYQEQLEQRVDTATQDLELVNRELHDTKEYLESLLHSTMDAIISTDASNVIEFANHGVERMLGYTQDELMGMPVARLYVGGANEVGFVRRKLDEGKPLQSYDTHIRKKDGGTIPVSISLSTVNGPEGEVQAVLAICKDITQQKLLEAELKEMSIKDSLTGLYNQRHFYDRLEAEIERARRQKHPLSLLLFDIDQFKTYNDCHGHLDGDHVLQTAGAVVMESTREHVDIGFRYGGDEFCVILPEAEERQALAIAERIRKGFRAKHFDNLTLSIGLMQYREGFSLREFIRFADAQMYDAKLTGGDRVSVYRDHPDDHGAGEDHASAQGRAASRAALEADAAAAAANEAANQPKEEKGDE